MAGLQSWITTFRNLGKRSDHDGSCNSVLPIDLHERLTKTRALAQHHLAECRYNADSEQQMQREHMSFKEAKSHWFEYNGGQQYQLKHEGKSYQIASDTWTRLSATMSKIQTRSEKAH